MLIYQNILYNKPKFRKDCDKNAVSLIRHLLEHDYTKRYGNLQNGNLFLYKDLKTLKIIDSLIKLHG